MSTCWIRLTKKIKLEILRENIKVNTKRAEEVKVFSQTISKQNHDLGASTNNVKLTIFSFFVTLKLLKPCSSNIQHVCNSKPTVFHNES